MNNDELVYFNGIDAETGQYLISPKTKEELTYGFLSDLPSKSDNKQLRDAADRYELEKFGVALGSDPEDLGDVGWALVFHEHETDAVKKALMPLFEHRRKQVNNDNIVKILDYRDRENSRDWLTRHKVGAGNIEPNKVPYYLLFVGDPEKIPFIFIHLTDIEYALGCIHFEEVKDYENYVHSVISYEIAETLSTAREACFFAPRHPFDRATQLSHDMLVKPLLEGYDATYKPIQDVTGFRTRGILAENATKEALVNLFSPGDGCMAPAFLFTASHGLGLKLGHAEQKTRQGALVCQDWSGFGSIREDDCFGGSDVPEGANLHGMICFHFACFGAGTPSHDRFSFELNVPPSQIAAKPFYASLPKLLLSKKNGGALACIGHIERAWGSSFITPRVGPQLMTFYNSIGHILLGSRVGHALRVFNERYAILSTHMLPIFEEIRNGRAKFEDLTARDWIERNDAESYVLLGDPAVRLRVEEMPPL